MAKLAGIDLTIWGLPPGSRVLDLGAASGLVAIELARQGLRVQGLEYDPKLVAEFKTRDTTGLDVAVVQGDGRNLQFKNGEFNGALALEVLEHITETDRVLGELYRVLKPGGRLVIGVPTAFSERIYYRLNPDFAKQADHVHVFAKNELISALEKAGFRVTQTRGENSEYFWLWLGLALAKTPFQFTGHTFQETTWEKLYWKAFKLLEIVHLRGLVESIGNQLWPRSLYIYAEKN